MSSVGQVVGGVVGGVIGFFAGGNVMLGASIGMAIGGAIDPPKGPNSVGPRLQDRRLQVSSYGHELPRLHGTIKTAGCIIWLENDEYTEHEVKKKSGGKGGGPKSTSTTYTYSATFAVALATCPAQQVAGLRKLWIAGQLVNEAASGNTESMLASAMSGLSNTLFNKSNSSSLATTGSGPNFTFYNGSDDQAPDPRWQADKGIDAVSGLPGVCYIVIHDLDLTKKYGNSLMAAQVEVEIVAEPVTITPLIEIVANTNTDHVINDVASVRSDGSAVEYGIYEYDEFHGDLNGVRFYRIDLYQRQTELGYCAKAYGNNERFLRVFVRQSRNTCALVQHQLTLESTSSNMILYRAGSLEPLEGTMMTSAQFPLNTQLKEAAIDDSAGETFVFSREAMKIYRFSGLDLDDSTAATYTLSDLGYTTSYLYGVKYESSVSASTVTIYKFDRADLSLLETWTGTANAHCLALHIAGDDAIYTGNASSGEVLKWANGAIVANLGAALPDDFSQVGLSSHVGWFGVFRDDPPAVIAHRAYDDASNGVYVSTPPLPAGTVGLRDLITRECALVGLEPADLDLASLTDHAVAGYSAIGSPRASLEPLQVAYLFDVFSSGYKLKFASRGTASVASIPESDLGATGDGKGVMLTDSREMSEQLPTATTVLYLDAAREYETGEQTVYQPGLTGVAERRVELAVVLTPDQAAQTADRLNKVARAERNELTFTIPSVGDYRKLEPADVITITHRGRIVECRIERIEDFPDGRRQCKGRPTSVAAYTSSAEGSYPLVNGATLLSILGISEAVLLDMPRIVSDQDTFGISAAVYGFSSGWPGGVLVRSDDGGSTWGGNTPFPTKSEVFTASTVLATGRSDVVDHASSVTVTPDWVGADLYDVSWAQLMSLGNLAAFGADGRWEIIAFENATASGDDYVLTGFLRGLYGSEHAMSQHAVGDRLVMLDIDSINYMTLPTSALGSPRLYRAVTDGGSIDAASEQEATCNGVSMKPLSPSYPRGYRDPVTYDWNVSWFYRSRLPVEPFSGTDTPIGESSERYEVEIWNSTYTTRIRTFSGLTSASFTYTFAQQVADTGLPLPETLYLKITQISAIVGAGYTLQTSLYRYNVVIIDNYGPAVMALSPIGFYRLNETSGTALTDASSSNNTATASASNITYNQTSLLPSGIGKCISVSNGGYFTVPRLAAMDGAFSVAFMIKVTSATGAQQCIFHKGGDWSNTALAGHRLAIKTDYGMQFSHYNGTYYNNNTTGAVLSLNTTAHIVVTYNGTTTFKIYKNGSIFETITLTNAIVNNTSNLTVASRVYSTGFDEGFSGNLDEFSYFPSELNATQITNLYAQA